MDVQVRFLPSGDTLTVAPGTTLLAAARRVGLPIASACGADGLCGRCGVQVTAGCETLSPEDSEEARAKRRNRVDPALRLACRTKLAADVEVTAAYW